MQQLAFLNLGECAKFTFWTWSKSSICSKCVQIIFMISNIDHGEWGPWVPAVCTQCKKYLHTIILVTLGKYWYSIVCIWNNSKRKVLIIVISELKYVLQQFIIQIFQICYKKIWDKEKCLKGLTLGHLEVFELWNWG